MIHFYFACLLSLCCFENVFASHSDKKRVRGTNSKQIVPESRAEGSGHLKKARVDGSEIYIPLWYRRGVSPLFLKQFFINQGLRKITAQTSSEKTRRFFNDICALEQTIVCSATAIPRLELIEQHVRLLVQFRRLKPILSETGQEHAKGPLLNIMRTIIKNP